VNSPLGWAPRLCADSTRRFTGIFRSRRQRPESAAPSYLIATPSSVPDSNLQYYIKTDLRSRGIRGFRRHSGVEPMAEQPAGMGTGWRRLRAAARVRIRTQSRQKLDRPRRGEFAGRGACLRPLRVQRLLAPHRARSETHFCAADREWRPDVCSRPFSPAPTLGVPRQHLVPRLAERLSARPCARQYDSRHRAWKERVSRILAGHQAQALSPIAGVRSLTVAARFEFAVPL